MDLLEINNSLENISLHSDQKKAFLLLIDAKIKNDMKEVIAELKHLEKTIEDRIQMTQDKIQMTQDKMLILHDKLHNEIKVVYWVVGIAMAIMLFVLSRK
jgi:hypothetical protein